MFLPNAASGSGFSQNGTQRSGSFTVSFMWAMPLHFYGYGFAPDKVAISPGRVGREPLWSRHPEHLLHEIRPHGPVDPVMEAHADPPPL